VNLTRYHVYTEAQRSMGGLVTTSKKDASKAAKILNDPKSSKADKSVAASDLSQAKRARTRRSSHPAVSAELIYEVGAHG
jgi:hypothetical protein